MKVNPFLFIALFCLVLYINSLSGEFVWDDQSFVVDNPAIKHLTNLPSFFTDYKTGATKELSSDVYRPLTTFSYALDFFFWGLNSFGYHLTNIILHSANSMLVFVLLMLLCGDFFAAFFGSLIFVSHPVQTEAVCWISGRSSVLFLLFYLLAFIFYIRALREDKKYFFAVSLIFFVLSLFSKEMAVTLPLVLMLYDLHFPLREKVKARISRYAAYFLLVFFYIILRITIVGKVGQFEGWGGPYTIFLTMSNVIVDYVRILFFPFKLCAVGYYIPIVSSLKEGNTIISLLLFFVVAGSLPFLFKKAKIFSFSIFFFFLTLLPVLNIIPIKALEADRFLYLPSIGFCLLIASVASKYNARLNNNAAAKKSVLVIVLAALLLFLYSLRTSFRVEDWKDEVVLSKKTVDVSPSSAWALTTLAANLFERGKYVKAIEPLEKAIRLSPEYEIAHNALAQCYLRTDNYEGAVSQFKIVLDIDPKSAWSRNLLGVAYMNLKKYDEAEKEFEIALKDEPDNIGICLNFGRVYEIKGDYKKALRKYLEMLEKSKNTQDTIISYLRIGDLYIKMNLRDKARTAYLKMQKISPEASAELKKIIEDRLKEL